MKSYHFDVGNSMDGPIGFCGRIKAESRSAAVALLRESLPQEVDITQRMRDLASGERRRVEYGHVYVNSNAIGVQDIDAVEDENGDEVPEEITPRSPGMTLERLSEIEAACGPHDDHSPDLDLADVRELVRLARRWILWIKRRLEYIRGELRAERISQGELNELASLAPYIEPDDVELREAAGLPERPPVAPGEHHANVDAIRSAGHTPGTWRVTQTGPMMHGEFLIYAGDDPTDSDAYIALVTGGLGCVLEDDRCYESEANAALIATAPVLLDALTDAVKQLESVPYWIEQAGGSQNALAGVQRTCKTARDAITQAKRPVSAGQSREENPSPPDPAG